MCVKSGSYSGTDNGKIKVYVNGIRIMNNTPKKIHSFYFQEERPHSHPWNFSKVINKHLATHNID